MLKIFSGAKKIISSPLNLVKKKTKFVGKSANDKSLFSKLSHTLKNKEIRNKLLVTLLIVAVCRFLAAVPLPGIDPAAFKDYFQGTPFNNIFTIITGGRLDNPSIVAIGLAPFIN